MKWKLKCAVEQEGDWYVSFCDELSIASQGRTVEEAKNNLEEAIRMFFEDASPSEIMKALSSLEPEVTVEIQREADIPPNMRSQDTHWELSVA
ncbi:MAG: type II toxin-antitoxin system HicB family antitoxin [Caldilineaceae bacterium]|nr:type II toxin-antitoxin system HicB family antitoxin [Caldilineaceae bacterium]